MNTKAVFVMAVCALWLPGELLLFCTGIAIPLAVTAFVATVTGVWPGYLEQVWRWGWIYAKGSPVAHPFTTGLARTFDWMGFHIALAVGSIFTLLDSSHLAGSHQAGSHQAGSHQARSRDDRWKLGAWLALSFLAVCLGTRFAPHYFLQLLPAMVVAGSRGLVLAWNRYRRPAMVFVALALAVPFFRFGPRYVSLAYDNLLGKPTQWKDASMDLDAQQVARVILGSAKPRDTLFVWGYRPDIYVYTRLASDSRFWDSQPLTGVPADRHLHTTEAIYGGPAAQNRCELVRSRPTWIVDGLGLLNPLLMPQAFPELRGWLKQYRVVGRTKLSIIYRRSTEGGF
jgi:hypothetical protein